MKKETMTISVYSEDKKQHLRAVSVKNPVAVMYQPKMAKKMVDDFVALMGLEIIDDKKPTLIPIDDSTEIPF